MKLVAKPNKTNLFIVLSLLFFFQANTTVAQEIRGIVVDDTGTPLPYASIVAYTLPDTVMIGGIVSDTTGCFFLASSCDLLRISFVGYETEWITSPQSNLGVINLKRNDAMLHEIEIKSRKPMIIYKPDGIVVEVQNSILKTTNDGMEMLSLTPSVWVDPMGSVSVLGRGTPVIYINHRRVQSTSELESLDPQFVKSVEVIRHPTAKYEADVEAVIIIKTIRRNDFYKVTTGGRIKKARDWSESGYADITFLQQRLAGNLYYEYREDRTVPVERTSYHGADDCLINYSYPYRYHYGGGHNLRAGVDFNIAPGHSIGWQGNAMLSSLRNTMNQLVQNEHSNTYDYYVPSGLNGHNDMYYNTLYYCWDIDSIGQKLEATFDYTHSNYDRCDTFRNIPVGASYMDYVLNSNNNTGSNDVYIGKLNYSLPWGDYLTLNVGTRYAAITGNSNTNIRGFTIYDNRVLTDERNLAGYVEGLVTLSDKWSAIAGIRAERTHRSFEENGNRNLDFTEQGLYPRLNIQFQPAKDYSISASYAKRVERPSFAALIPSLTADSLSNSMGNPNLTNSFTHDFYLEFNFPHNIGAAVSYERTMNPLIQSIITSTDNSNILEKRWDNGNSYNSYKAMVWANLQPTSWWYLYLMMYYGKSQYEFDYNGVTVINDKPEIRGYVSNTLKLPKQWKIAFNVRASSLHSTLTWIQGGLWSVYFQAGKEMLNRALSVTLYFNDILGTNVSQQWSLLPGERYSYFDTDSRFAGLFVKYKFGKAKKSYYSRTLSTEERGRLLEE